MRTIRLFLYYAIFRHLPATDNTLPYREPIRKLRRWAVGALFDYMGPNVNIEKGADFGTGKGISIGKNSDLGINCKVRGPLEIGEDVMMGPNCIIITSSHNHSDISKHMIYQGDTVPQKVTIEDDCWIGFNSMSLFCQVSELGKVASLVRVRLLLRTFHLILLQLAYPQKL